MAENSDHDEEVSYIVVDAVDVEANQSWSGQSIEIRDLESQNPIVQIGEMVFRGHFSYLPSTSLLFEIFKESDESETKAHKSSDNQTAARHHKGHISLEYTGKAEKQLSLSSVLLVPKSNAHQQDLDPKLYDASTNQEENVQTETK
eukprot:TRINITY_DN5835_c0_g1_i1.p1 TRINITY_DN5835_c0_g1~~TRINITY_DN5835_c0_g1_i1.p1  ORF type:complete len:146 (+),score=38.11 TRINITY_DN5835_c0_g1_i1:791-1228(+)